MSSVIASGLWPSIFVDVLMAQLVRALTGWGPRFNPRPGRYTIIARYITYSRKLPSLPGYIL